jgi:hypothetical protein
MVPVAWLAAAQGEIKEPRLRGKVKPKATKRSHVSSTKRGKKR